MAWDSAIRGCNEEEEDEEQENGQKKSNTKNCKMKKKLSNQLEVLLNGSILGRKLKGKTIDKNLCSYELYEGEK